MKLFELEYQLSKKEIFKRKFKQSIMAIDYKDALKKGNLIWNTIDTKDLDIDYIKIIEKKEIISDYTILLDIGKILSGMKKSDNIKAYNTLKILESLLRMKVNSGNSEIFTSKAKDIVYVLRDIIYNLGCESKPLKELFLKLDGELYNQTIKGGNL